MGEHWHSFVGGAAAHVGGNSESDRIVITLLRCDEHCQATSSQLGAFPSPSIFSLPCISTWYTHQYTPMFYNIAVHFRLLWCAAQLCPGTCGTRRL